MSDFAILSDVTNELRRQISDSLRATPVADFGLGETSDPITLRSPGEKAEPGIIASLYLYHLDINHHLRNQLPVPDGRQPDRFHRPPLPLQLRYLFTPLSDKESTNQLLLGRVLQHFQDFPSFDMVSGQPISDAFGSASPELRVKPDLLDREQLFQLWNAFSAPYRVALGLLVEAVAVESGQPPARRRRVGEFITAVGKRKVPS